MEDILIDKTLFFYYIIKTDDLLNLINENNKIYFKTLVINYFGETKFEILNKQDFLIVLQNNINKSLQTNFRPSIKVVLDRNISINLNSKYIGKVIEFILKSEENNYKIKNIVFENKVTNI